MKKYCGITCIALLIFVLISNAVPVLAIGHSSDIETIRVGYMDHPGFIEFKNGEPVGYGVAYLEEICRYTGWQVEYKHASWSEQLEMLEKGEIDIVPLAQYSAERAEKFLYTNQSMGLIQCMLLTLPNDEYSLESNALACDGKKVAILKESRNIELFNSYSKQIGFECELLEYDYQDDLEQALLNGEVDIIACEQMIGTSNLQVLDRFASDPYYMITSKENTKLMSELNYVISKINAYDPLFASKLYEQYYGNTLAAVRPYFTIEETEYIKSHPVVTLAAIPDNEPLAYIGEDGELIGIIPSIMEELSGLCGIKFRYEFVPYDITPLAFLNKNPTYMGTGMLASNPAFKEENMLVSKTYYTTYAALVARGSKKAEPEYKTNKYSIGVPKSFQALQLFLKENYPNLTIKEYLTTEDGLKSLAKGNVDLFAYTLSLITPHLSNPLFGDIYVLDNRFMPCNLCTVCVNTPENEILIGILDKCISLLQKSYVSQLESDFFYKNSYHYSDRDAISRFRQAIVHTAFTVAAIILGLLLFLWLRQRKFNRDITIRTEYDMLTGLYNRTTATKKVDEYLEQNIGISCALIVFDIDNLTLINETSGQEIGNEIIKAITNIAKKHFGESAIAGRISGDDFLVLLPGIESKSVLSGILTKFQKMVGATVVSDTNITLSVSIGVVMFKSGVQSVEEAFQHANDIMHHVKANGKNGFEFYSAQKATPYASIRSQLLGSGAKAAEQGTTGAAASHNQSDSDFRRLVEAFPNVTLHVIEEASHRILYYNKQFKAYYPNISDGMSCRDIMLGACDNCIVDTMGEQATAHAVCYNAAFGGEVEVTATKLIWGDGIPAVMITIWSRTPASDSK